MDRTQALIVAGCKIHNAPPLHHLPTLRSSQVPEADPKKCQKYCSNSLVERVILSLSSVSIVLFFVEEITYAGAMLI